MKKYWLYLEPYVFYWMNEKEGLIYNTLTYNSFTFKKSRILMKLIRQLDDLKNMYCVEINQNTLLENSVEKFVSELEKTTSGGLVEFSPSRSKPVLIPPKLKILRTSFNKIAEEVKSYLNEITFYINGQCDQKCYYCSYCYKQFLFCTKAESELSILNINKILNQIGDYHLKCVNIIGGNILKYRHLNNLISSLDNLKIFKIYNINYNDFDDQQILHNIVNNRNNLLRVLVNKPIINTQNIKHIISKYPNTEWVFPVTQVNEFKLAIEFVEYYNIRSYEIEPLFTNSNIDFFNHYVFLKRSDIRKIKLGRRKIFQKQVINTNDYGKLIVFSDGKIYANINHNSIGDDSTPICEVLQNEIMTGTSWRRTRINSQPCSKCIYRLICPSPSNYEIILGRMNLCNIK